MLENKDVKILIVDDEEETRDIFSRKLKKSYLTETADSVNNALLKIENSQFHLVITDLVMPEKNGLTLLSEIKERYPYLPVVVISGNATLSMVVKAMQMGAADFIEKPVEDLDLLKIIVDRVLTNQWNLNELKRLQDILNENFDRTILIGNSFLIQKLLDKVKRLALVDSTVLISGETGVGKEVFAELLYKNSPRANKKFVTVNCGSLPESLLESMLFGHKKGAFTSAIRDQIGYFEEANGGTLFLDEISETSLSFQTKLLRVLEKKMIRKIGDTLDIPVNVRIIAATNRDLLNDVHEGKFREDLYYRLNVMQLNVPPLRERPEDIEALSNHFLKLFSDQYNKKIIGISPSAISILCKHNWKGNVRELKNTIEHSVIMTNQNIIGIEDLPAYINTNSTEKNSLSVENFTKLPYSQAKEEFDLIYLKTLLKESNGDVSLASQTSGIARQNLYDKFKKYNINPDIYRNT
jgi:DNA-binding NtrC family response regulator